MPYLLVLGDDDVASGTVGVNVRASDAPERGVAVGALVERIVADAASRAVAPAVAPAVVSGGAEAGHLGAVHSDHHEPDHHEPGGAGAIGA